MAEAKHTPGPFEAIKGSEESDGLRCAVVAKRGTMAYLVATIENGAPGDFCDTEWANACLFASALDLLDALEGLIPCAGSPVVLPDTAERVRAAVAAIAKAKGGAS